MTFFCEMAPGPFSGLLAPFIGARKSKKYEKLQTEDPEKKRQEATQDEINRLHNKIVSFGLFLFTVKVLLRYESRCLDSFIW